MRERSLDMGVDAPGSANIRLGGGAEPSGSARSGFAGGCARRHGRAAGRVRDRHAARVRAEAAVPGRHHGYRSRPGLALLPEPVPARLLHRYLPAVLQRGPGRREGPYASPGQSPGRVPGPHRRGHAGRHVAGQEHRRTIRGRAFFDITAVLLAVCAVAGVLATARAAGGGPALAGADGGAVPGAHPAAFVNWDLIALALMALGLAAWAARRVIWAGVLFGLAVATKFYPLIVFGPLLLLCLRPAECASSPR